MNDKEKQRLLDQALDRLMSGPVGQRNERGWDNKIKLELAREVLLSKPVSKETRKKMTKAAKGRINKASIDPKIRAKAAATMSKGVIVYSYPAIKEIGRYKNNKEAGDALDIHRSIIASVARGIYKQCRGYTFEYIKKDSRK